MLTIIPLGPFTCHPGAQGYVMGCNIQAQATPTVDDLVYQLLVRLNTPFKLKPPVSYSHICTKVMIN